MNFFKKIDFGEEKEMKRFFLKESLVWQVVNFGIVEQEESQ